MSKELEALEIIKNTWAKTSDWCDEQISIVCSYEVEIIEKALKALEIIKKINKYNLRALIDQSFLIDETITFDEHDLLKKVLL